MENKKLSPAVRVVLIVVGLLIIGLIALSASGIPVFAAGECKAPEGYLLIENRMAADLMTGNPVYIVRGIGATGEGVSVNRKFYIPQCGSSDPSIEEVGNVFVWLDGRQVLLLSGSVGRDISQ